MKAFAEAYEKLVDQQPIKCIKSGTEFAAVCHPDLVFVDVGQLKAHRLDT